MNPKRIMLVEDNPDDELLTLRALQKINVLSGANEIVVARDGVEALDYLHDRDEDVSSEILARLPQLILLDLKLPKVDGLQVLSKIRANPRTERVPVVVLTSSDEEKDISRSYDYGANSYIRKPIDFSQFIDTIGQLGMYWLLLNEVPKN